MSALALSSPRQRFRFLIDREAISTTHLRPRESIAALSAKLTGTPRRSVRIKASAAIDDEEQTIEFTIDNTETLPGWLVPSLKQAVRLLFLPVNWDFGGARPIERSSIISAINALLDFMAEDGSIPQWLPTSEGGVQLEWHESGIDLEMEFSPDGSECEVVFGDLNVPGNDWDGPLRANRHRLNVAFDRLHRTD